MRRQNKKWGAALGVCAALLSWSAVGQAQVFDTPVSDFTLEAIPTGDFPFPNLPTTLNIGNFDTSILASGDRTLNEVAIAGVSQFAENTQVPTLIHRYWTIVHDSATDTRSLVQTDPSDIPVTSEFEPFYLIPDSLNLLDLDGNGADDIAVLGAVLELNDNAAEVSGIKLQKSGTTGPVGVFGVPSQAGPNFFETSLNILGQQTDSSIPGLFGGVPSQPSLTQADFDGNGRIDLAFYDFIVGDPSVQVAVSLDNNGTFGTLPRTDTTLNLSPDYQGNDFAYNLVAADIDGDGAPDLAISFDAAEGSGIEDSILVFKGNGDGSFVPDAIASAIIPKADAELAGLAVGNFDGDDFLDFAVTSFLDESTDVDVNIVLCHPGAAACVVNEVALPDGTVPFSFAANDFDDDGLDDLAASFIRCNQPDALCEPSEIETGVAILLNQGGSFNATPDQELLLGGAANSRFTVQVVSKDIDACGGPDLAYTGFQISDPVEAAPVAPAAIVAQGPFSNTTNFASVAFNHNDDPVADAGTPVQTTGGFRVGGDPTCSGELGEVLSIQWEVLSGDATISDAAAANPIVSADNESVVQVTCTDACGAASSATVIVQGAPFLFEGSGCSLGQASAGGMAWFLGLIGVLPLVLRRLRD